ncbi:glutamate racemase [Candidatus Palibaumannia cicadellinicola]|uniref:Glutamate racemase n=1 Tax=Candidatus Palibaumannia cicadellinicola TaxID=186490 RepID=A0A0K2BK05_9GAMM|nr:glutamate racemase [Candidatus Baumannia cicadellinicola]AKZ65751.1 Glutamate racemase [Candidatus Baumannia cicadellinicola]
MLDKNTNPTILVIDSGVGGFSILYEVKKIIKNVNYIYVFDNEEFPYGKKTKQFLLSRVIKIINSVCKIHSIDIIIIACNTLSTVSLPLLRRYFICPIIGVLPAIKLAAKITRSRVIGLLATQTTINSNYTNVLIKKLASSYKIIPFIATKLVYLAEDKFHGKIISLIIFKNILNAWLKQVIKLNLDTIILGCTHFPLIYEELRKIIPKNIKLIYSHKAIAKKALCILKYNNKYNTLLSNNTSTINTIYCLLFNNNTTILMPKLSKYGFHSMKKLYIY